MIFSIYLQINFFIFQEQAIRSGSGGGLGGGKNYDSVSNNDRDGYGQPDGKRETVMCFTYI